MSGGKKTMSRLRDLQGHTTAQAIGRLATEANMQRQELPAASAMPPEQAQQVRGSALRLQRAAEAILAHCDGSLSAGEGRS